MRCPSLCCGCALPRLWHQPTHAPQTTLRPGLTHPAPLCPQTECNVTNCAGCTDPSTCDACMPGYALDDTGACILSVEDGSTFLAVGAGADLPAPSDKVRCACLDAGAERQSSWPDERSWGDSSIIAFACLAARRGTSPHSPARPLLPSQPLCPMFCRRHVPRAGTLMASTPTPPTAALTACAARARAAPTAPGARPLALGSLAALFLAA